MNWKAALWTGVGVALGLAINSMIAGAVDPLLANVGLSVSVA